MANENQDNLFQSFIDNSPLKAADPASLDILITEGRVNEIFNKKPLDISNVELLAVVKYFRDKRKEFLIEEEKKNNEPKKTRGGKKPTNTKEALDWLKDIEV